LRWTKKNIDSLLKRHYVLKADQGSNYWFGLSDKKVKAFRQRYNENFTIILKGSDTDETDFYVIPYVQIKDLLVADNLYLLKNRKRWVGHINNHILHIRNSLVTRDISGYYSNPKLLNYDIQLNDLIEEVDYGIENAKKEIAVRLKQSKFRKEVLRNFNYKCCLTGIEETGLLVASHIVPWASKIESRLDPKNGLCLSVMYDKLFDLGYFSFDDTLKTIITTRVRRLSPPTQAILKGIQGRKVSNPLHYPIETRYLEFHRRNIFDTF